MRLPAESGYSAGDKAFAIKCRSSATLIHMLRRFKRSVVTMGNFDGIHLGHQALIGGAVEDARSLRIPSVVLTFEPHPLHVLAPERAPKMLLSHKDKMELLRSLGVDVVMIQHFDLQFAKLAAEGFVRAVLLDRLKAAKIWVGKDLRFGQGRKGRCR